MLLEVSALRATTNVNAHGHSEHDVIIPEWAVWTTVIIIIIAWLLIYIWWFYALFTFKLNTAAKIAVIFVGLIFSPLLGVISAYVLRD